MAHDPKWELKWDETKTFLPDYFPEGINQHIKGYVHDLKTLNPKYVHDQQYRSLMGVRSMKEGDRPKRQTNQQLDKLIRERIQFLDKHMASKKNGGKKFLC